LKVLLCVPSECGRGIKKHGGQAAQPLGRSRGGFSTTIHAGCLNAKTGVAFVLTGGERNDMTPLIPSKSNRQEISDYDQDKYKLLEKVERFFNE
jgi:hypothetical protein